MQSAIAVGKVIALGFAWLLLIIFFDVAITIIHEDANFTRGQFTAFLNPCDLTIVINWLHTIAADTNTKISTVRDCTLWKRNSFKILFIEECTSTSRNGKSADLHIDIFFFKGVLGSRLVCTDIGQAARI